MEDVYFNDLAIIQFLLSQVKTIFVIIVLIALIRYLWRKGSRED